MNFMALVQPPELTLAGLLSQISDRTGWSLFKSTTPTTLDHPPKG